MKLKFLIAVLILLFLFGCLQHETQTPKIQLNVSENKTVKEPVNNLTKELNETEELLKDLQVIENLFS